MRNLLPVWGLSLQQLLCFGTRIMNKIGPVILALIPLAFTVGAYAVTY
jgi:hypothetical protein